MKNLKLITLVAALAFCAAPALAQEKAATKKKSTVRIAEPTTTPEYVVKTKKLMGYFISGQIPADFPKYDANLTKEENQAIAKAWAKEHLDLLTEEAKAKLND